MILTVTAPLVIVSDEQDAPPRYHYRGTVVDLPDEQAQALLDQGVAVEGDTLPEPPTPAPNPPAPTPTLPDPSLAEPAEVAVEPEPEHTNADDAPGDRPNMVAVKAEWVEWAIGRTDADGNTIDRERAEAMTKPALQELSAGRAAG